MRPVEEVMTSPRRRAQRLAQRHMSFREGGAGAVAVRSRSGRGAESGSGNSGSVAAAAITLGEIGVESDPCEVLSTRSCVSQLDFSRQDRVVSFHHKMFVTVRSV